MNKLKPLQIISLILVIVATLWLIKNKLGSKLNTN